MLDYFLRHFIWGTKYDIKKKRMKATELKLFKFTIQYKR